MGTFPSDAGLLCLVTSGKEIIVDVDRNKWTAKQARGAIEQVAGNERPCRYSWTDAFITEVWINISSSSCDDDGGACYDASCDNDSGACYDASCDGASSSECNGYSCGHWDRFLYSHHWPVVLPFVPMHRLKMLQLRSKYRQWQRVIAEFFSFVFPF